LLNAAEAYRKLGRSPQAAAALGRIVKEYPESALAAQAKKELEGK
jgi:TolA-binding protein